MASAKIQPTQVTTLDSASVPGEESVTLSFPDLGIEVPNWTEYEYASHLEVPSDGWSFSMTGDDLEGRLGGLRPFDLTGQSVQLKVGNAVQGTGFVDRVSVRNDRHSGTVFNVQGRDRLAYAIGAHADPTKVYKEGTTLLDLLIDLFGPFGWDSEDSFLTTNAANTAAKASNRGIKTSKKKGIPLKQRVIHQLRPYPNEGVFAFASRVANRHGLMIWQAANGESLILSTPDFEIQPWFTARRNAGGTGNVLAGSVEANVTNQATTIVADGHSSSPDFGIGPIKSIMANTVVLCDDPDRLIPWERYPDAHRVPGQTFSAPLSVPLPRNLYLHDDESQTQAQLDNFLRRSMAAIQRESIQAHYTVEGHGQIVDGFFLPFVIDTTIDVEDDVAGFRERMYIVGRRFRRSRHGGTTTELELIRLHTIELGDPPDPEDPPRTPTDADITRQRRELEREETLVSTG